MNYKPVSMAVAVFAATSVALSLGGAATASMPASSESISAELPISSISVQQEFEHQLETFLRAHHEPAPLAADATMEEQNGFAKTAYDFWKSVPWEAVAGQWGCLLGNVGVTYLPADRHGVVTAAYGTIIHCGKGVAAIDPDLISEPRTKTSLLSERAAQGQNLGPLYLEWCSTQGNAQLCLLNPQYTIKARTLWLGGTVTGQARLGGVSPSGPCLNGSLVAITPVGIGGYGTIWTASAQQLVNGRWSSAFIISGGVYGRFCDFL